ncbi:MAG TPA: branched-chain amino acid ABC transporter permease [Burkholderiales bacterium]|nr:branched-chain amino acid ABC transporter permease [Burkholderiales bacterium]
MKFKRKSFWPVIVTALSAALFVLLFLYLEHEWEIALLAVGLVAVLFFSARFGLLARVETAASDHPRTTILVNVVSALLVIVFLREEHFALLMLATVFLYVTICLGLTLQFGYAGIVNFAGIAFFGIGSYTAAVLAVHSPLPHLLVILVSGLVAGLIGSLLILPMLRTRGHYAALVTIAFGILFRTFLEVNDLLGGPQGLKVPGMQLFGWSLNDNISLGPLGMISFYASYAVISLLLAAGAYTLIKRLERSWLGLNLDAVRTDETAAASFGIDLPRWKIFAFTAGNCLAGVAGGVYAMMSGFIAPASFNFGDSLLLVSIVLLGGSGNPLGVLPAALLVVVLPEKLQIIQEYRLLLFAVLVILILRFRPEGLLPRRIREYYAGWGRS